jgi:PhnB protein
VKGSEVPDGYVIPHIVVHDANGAAEFYCRAFGAVEVYRSPQPTGVGLHIHMRMAKSLIMVCDDASAHDPADLASHYAIGSPRKLGGTSVVIHCSWPDVDAVYRRAVEAGAQPTVPPFDAFWGDRYGCVTDPYGHVWAITTRRESPTPEEVTRRMNSVATTGAKGESL